MNQRKKKGTSRKGKGTVTDAALKRSAKTAKKPKKKRSLANGYDQGGKYLSTTTGKGANYRPTKSGAGMTKKGSGCIQTR